MNSAELNYHIFKENIKPMWEDPCNRGGGSIDIVLGRQYQYTKLDRLWFELLMAALGNQFEEHNEKICGMYCLIMNSGFIIFRRVIPQPLSWLRSVTLDLGRQQLQSLWSHHGACGRLGNS